MRPRQPPGNAAAASSAGSAATLAAKPKGTGASLPPTAPKRALPRPWRTALDDAEARLSESKRKYDAARAKTQAKIDALKDKLVAIDKHWVRERGSLDAEVNERRTAYDNALARWQAEGT